MRLTTAPIVVTALLLGGLPCFGAPHARRAVTQASFRHASYKAHRSERVERVVEHHETPAMPPERATAIQSALIRSGYMAGEPSGSWDADSVVAMQKLQLDNGWQTKIVPDSRALIKLGLGPR